VRLADFPNQLQSVQDRHLQIRDDDVWLELVDQVEGFSTVVGNLCDPARFDQQALNQHLVNR